MISPLLAFAAATAAIPAGPALTQAIAARDAELFAVMFDRCEPAELRGMVTPDMEFYHDKGGAMIGGETFVADYAKSCEAKKTPDAWRSRRALVAGSIHVDPVPGFGAIETGEHLFYERRGDGPEKLAGRASFAIVWKYDSGTWKIARVLSYAHAPATEK